ncbi:mitochondrial 54S ribosomal protein YmL16 [Alternaria alternata]|nr:mitochondrial 54S ribosomal protein YmL16 [Alternaria alternata]
MSVLHVESQPVTRLHQAAVSPKLSRWDKTKSQKQRSKNGCLNRGVLRYRGFLQALILAANCMTTSFSGPSNSRRVGCGVLAVMPFGIASSTGCVYPTFKFTNFWPGNSAFTVVAVSSTEAR